MARYSLRNQNKIAHAYSQEYLQRMIRSLNEYFENATEIEELDSGDNRFNMIAVDDIDHTVSQFAFYIISKTYDVYRLAFKEVIK